MADEAFALSPISARASQPREEDYDAINEAFMETSRGRWFLGEYAKRNRNADTRMVLDAVARIEVNLAAQKQPAPEPDNGLAEALVEIKGAVEQARISALAALDNHMLEEALAPIRKGARIVKEIAWRWREIGADPRICDLLDSQVGAIEAGCGQVASHDPLTALSTAFDLLEGRIRQLDDSDADPAEAETVASPPFPPPSDEMPAAAEEAAEAAVAMDDTEDAVRAEAMRAETVAAGPEAADTTAETADVTVEVAMTAEDAVVAIETADLTVEAPDVTEEVADAVAETADITEVAEVMVGAVDLPAEAADIPAEIADADQDAVLDMIAFEMAAPDPADADEAADRGSDEIHVTKLPPAKPEIIAQITEPEPEQTASLAIAPTMPPSIETSVGVPMEASAQAWIQASAEASAETSTDASTEASLGSSLITNGIVRRLHASGPDPLAPIRRMSQAEKIALFS
jgi:hypothetical protein